MKRFLAVASVLSVPALALATPADPLQAILQQAGPLIGLLLLPLLGAILIIPWLIFRFIFKG